MSAQPSQHPQEGELLPLAEQSNTAVVEYTETAAALADLRKRLQNVVFDVRTTAGNKAARAARLELVTLRTALDKKRLQLNADDQGRIRGRNAEATRITSEIKALEDPLDKQLTDEEERKAAEKRAKEEAEAKRVADIQERIEQDIRAIPLVVMGRSARDIEIFIRDVVAMVIDEAGFAEFQKQAEGARTTTLIRLRAAHANAVAAEEDRIRLEKEHVRLEEQRAENERVRLANEAAAKVEQARLAESVRLAKEELERERLRQEAAADVERARIAEEERVAREAREAEAARQATENERIRAENEKAAAAERQRIADLQASIDAQIAAQEAKDREWARIDAERQAEAQRIADERAQLERDQEALRAEREKPAAVDAPLQPGEPMTGAPDVALPDPGEQEAVHGMTPEPAAESGSVALAAEEPADPLLMTIRLIEWLPMQSVCKAAKEWAVFQDPDSKLDQKKDRKLAAQAREAASNLVAAVELLP